MPDSEFAAVADVFGLGPIEAVTRPATGSMNETYLLRLRDRSVVLRKHRRTDRSQIEYEHDVMEYARRGGIPVPAALLTRDGDRFVQLGGCWHSVFAYAPGRQVEADDIDAVVARGMGVMLARTHLALSDHPVPESDGAPPRQTVESTLQRLAEIKAAISARTELTGQDHDALEYLDGQARALEAGHSPPDLAAAEAMQLIHGDYQHNNLFFDSGTVCAVIDWDKAEAKSPGGEVVRAMDLSFRLQPLLCRAFIDGYREVRGLPATTLDGAAGEYGFGQLHGLWVYETFYLHGDDRVGQFRTPPPFVPFADRWVHLRPSL